MDSDGCDAVGSGAMKRRHSIPKSHDGAMTSGNSGQRRACPATEESGMDGHDPAPDSQDTVVERKDELAVFIGNLRTDVCDATLKESIMGVFAVAGVNISASQVMLVHKAFATHAFVYLTSADEKTWALKGFGSQLDLSSIAIPGKKLKVRSKSFGAVSYRRPEHSSMQMSALTERSSIDSSGSSALLLDNDGASYLPGAMLIIDENSSDDSEVVNADDIHLVHPQKAALTSKAPHAQHREQSPSQVEPALISMSEPPPPTTNRHSNDVQVPSSGHINSTEMQTQTVKQTHTLSKTTMNFYVVGQNLGNESRHKEFKAGQGTYLQKQLKDHVAKYMCAFLNSEGGTLLVGVNDSGEVLGIQCTQRIEDLLRQKMDATIKEIAPQVFPNMYTIDFVPVCDISNVPIENRKILEITVKQTNTSSLYQTYQGHVFIRRDGSVQGPLKASDIQEWTRMMMRKEMAEREVALQAVQQKDIHLEREMDKQRRMTMVLTRELKSERRSTRQLKAQLRRIDPKQLKRIEARLVLSNHSSLSKEDERDHDEKNGISHVATSTPVTNVVTINATTTTASAPAAHKAKTRSGSIISRISAMVKTHKSIPVESTPSHKSTPTEDTPSYFHRETSFEDIPAEPHKSTPLEDTPSHPHKAIPLEGTPSDPHETAPIERTSSEGLPEACSIESSSSNNSFALSEKNQLTFGGGHDGMKIPVGTAVVPRKQPTAPRFSLNVEPHSTKSRSCAIM